MLRKSRYTRHVELNICDHYIFTIVIFNTITCSEGYWIIKHQGKIEISEMLSVCRTTNVYIQ